MYNSPLYLIVLFLHVISFIVGFGAVIVIDTFGLVWLLKWWGVDLSLLKKVAGITQRLIWLGWVGLVVTGAVLLYMKGVVSGLTQLKVFLVLMVGINGVFMHFIKKSLEALPEAANNVPRNIIFRISLASFISQLGWWGATLIGFLNRQVKPPISFPYPVWFVIAGICLLIAFLALIGESLTRNKQKQYDSKGFKRGGIGS